MIADRLHLLADEMQKQILRYQTQQEQRIRRLWLLALSITTLVVLGLSLLVAAFPLNVLWSLCLLAGSATFVGFALRCAVNESRWLRERTQWAITQIEEILADLEMRTREWGEEFAQFEFQNYFERYCTIRTEAFERPHRTKSIIKFSRG